MVNVGVVGLVMGGEHLQGYKRVPDVKILAICDLNQALLKEQAEKFSVPHTFSDYRKMLEVEELDAVTIALPNFLHCPVTLDALEAGKHVLIEKPMAMNSSEAEKMIKKAKEKSKVLAVAMNYRFAPERMMLKKMVERGELGEIYYVRAVSLRRRTFSRELLESADSLPWFARKEKSGGGSLIDMGPHMLDMAMWYCNDFKPVSAYGVTSYRMKNGDADDLSSALVKLSGGVTISLVSTWESFTKPRFFISLFGTKGGAETDPLRIYREVDGADIEVKPGDVEMSEDSFICAMSGLQSHFVECIRDGKRCQVSGEKGLVVMKIIDAIYESAETGKEVEIS